LVVKLGGDALASAERIAAEAHRLARLAARGPVVAVASARRGVTDRLLQLVGEVGDAARRLGAVEAAWRDAAPEADRVVASGEVVAASLLALALNELGVAAVSLDAREAGVAAAGRFGGARIRRVNPRRIAQHLARGVVPVITGFQGWYRGRVATLARGGTDTSAVALAAALGADRVLFVKDAEGLRTADPRLVPESRPITRAPHRFLTALTAAGARVVQAEAAALGEAHGITLEFHPLGVDAALSVVSSHEPGAGLRAVTSAPASDGHAAVTVVAADGADLGGLVEPIRSALQQAGIALAVVHPAAGGLRFVVPADLAPTALRVIHAIAVEAGGRCTQTVRRVS
jgi:aspartate kinase